MFSRKPSRSFAPLVVALVSAAALALVAGCSSSSLSDLIGGPGSAARSAVVPDFGNNRVLIYDQPFSNGMAATTVIGQPDFATTTAGGDAVTLSGPNGVSADAAGNLFVADTKNDRVLRFNKPLANGEAATLALGQPDLTTVTAPGGAAPTPTNLNGPSDVVVDGDGNVWVSDSHNDRVVMYPAPISMGMAATQVLGQPNLTTNTCSVSSTNLCTPVGITFDPGGNVWVADAGNNRVVRFPAGATTGTAATIVLGQPDLNSNAPNNGGLSASSLDLPNAVIVDNSGNVWVADSGNNRVLEYLAPITSGMAASVVLGQPDFTSNSINQGGTAGATTLSSPAGLQLTEANHLLVGDRGNSRSLIYASPYSTNMAATTVLGQADFTGSSANRGGAAAANTQNIPWGAGPSLIALLTLALLIAGWFFYQRRRGVREGSAA